MEKRVLILPLLLAFVVTNGCNNSSNTQLGDGNFVRVEENDDAMNVAIAKAKRTFHLFEKNWQEMENDGYSIKFAMKTSDDGIEHIWFSPLKIDGNQITAECANNPVDIPGLKIGDIKKLHRTSISDWMIVVGNKCYGGYTIKALKSQQAGSTPSLEFVEFSE